jgi:opacity protein-like surface antigen
LQSNSALSYGGGVSYAISDNLYLRLDWRQYVVFSVKGIALDQARQQVEEETGVEIPASVTDDNTVQYNELSLGVSFKF